MPMGHVCLVELPCNANATRGREGGMDMVFEIRANLTLYTTCVRTRAIGGVVFSYFRGRGGDAESACCTSPGRDLAHVVSATLFRACRTLADPSSSSSRGLNAACLRPLLTLVMSSEMFLEIGICQSESLSDELGERKPSHVPGLDNGNINDSCTYLYLPSYLDTGAARFPTLFPEVQIEGISREHR
ncbi:hypothetical protein LZ32DRAFT_228399 [Colletotrichum eremochloae]|nr:hypothetical protein LZ32DRAFT_228399 [Colletotrichum eremochloae]